MNSGKCCAMNECRGRAGIGHMHESTCPPLTRHELRSSCAFDNLVGRGGFRPEEPPQRRVSKPRLTCRPGMGKAEARHRARICRRGIVDLGERPAMRDRVAVQHLGPPEGRRIGRHQLGLPGQPAGYVGDGNAQPCCQPERQGKNDAGGMYRVTRCRDGPSG